MSLSREDIRDYLIGMFEMLLSYDGILQNTFLYTSAPTNFILFFTKCECAFLVITDIREQKLLVVNYE